MSTLIIVSTATPTTAAPADRATVPDGVPALFARGLTVATPRGVVVDGVDAVLPHGAVGAVVGGSRSGKSTLLLALTGRMRHVSGELRVAGHDGVRHPAQVRRVTSVARVAGLVAPEASLTLEECVTERTLFDAGSPRTRWARYLRAAHLLDLDAPRSALFGSLAPADQSRAAVALACIRPSELVVLDDLDRGATVDEQAELWAGLLALAADGLTLVAATAERAALPPAVVTLDLDPRN